jgi:uncharacterized protein YgiB involved in biofilm formation
MRIAMKKKSRVVKLALIGSAGMVAACDGPPPDDAKFYSSLKECSAIHGEASCQDGQRKSEAIHLAEAPKFARKEACEQEFGTGNCETRQSSSGSMFLPLMMGYMLGKSFNQPVYRGRDGSAVTRSGGKYFNVGSFSGTGSARAFKPAASPMPIQRAGFGTTARAFRTSSGG